MDGMEWNVNENDRGERERLIEFVTFFSIR